MCWLWRTTDCGEPVRRPGEKVLSVQNLSMQNIVRNSSFSIFGGQVTGLFGLAGSGRSEMARIVAGVAKRDLFHGGEVRFGGRSVCYHSSREAVGDGIVYVTSYLPEILAVSARILVSRAGRIVEELSAGEATSEAIMFAAVY